MDATPGYRRGDLVEVKSLSEILGTLDADGKLEGLLFMPEMAQFCGHRFRVYRRATKTCVEGAGVRRVERAVLLDGLRCDGAAHGGCQRACLLFWKEAWLNPCDCAAPAVASGDGSEPRKTEDGPDARVANLPTRKGDRFYCQSTELPGATHELPGSNLHHFFRDFLAGDLTFIELSRSLWHKGINRLRRRFGHGLHRRLAGCEANPAKGDLNLQPGEWVEVKNAEEIASLLDPQGKNWGLAFETEMLDYCGRRFQVAFAIQQIIGEEPGKKSWGKMIKLANTVALKGVTCRGLCMKNCPRSNYLWWREVWLRRVAAPPACADAGDRREPTVPTPEVDTASGQDSFLTGVP